MRFAAPESDRYTYSEPEVQARIRASIPSADVRWRYGVVLNGFAVVVHHDATLERTTSGRGPLDALTADELASPRVRSRLDRMHATAIIDATTL